MLLQLVVVLLLLLQRRLQLLLRGGLLRGKLPVALRHRSKPQVQARGNFGETQAQRGRGIGEHGRGWDGPDLAHCYRRLWQRGKGQHLQPGRGPRGEGGAGHPSLPPLYTTSSSSSAARGVLRHVERAHVQEDRGCRCRGTRLCARAVVFGRGYHGPTIV
uniref:Putative secreted protein n=1 Tax=Ixodes ricinus TaxID=34613 RepID=A0A6B0UX46_IXORI